MQKNMLSLPQIVAIGVMYPLIEEDDCWCCHSNADVVWYREITGVGVKPLTDVVPGNSLAMRNSASSTAVKFDITVCGTNSSHDTAWATMLPTQS